MTQKLTTMHLYPADYAIIKKVANGRRTTIPEAAHMVIDRNNLRLQAMKELQTLTESIAKV